jgi:hypothetical protein
VKTVFRSSSKSLGAPLLGAMAVAAACGGVTDDRAKADAGPSDAGKADAGSSVVPACLDYVRGCCPSFDYKNFDPGPPVTFTGDVMPIFRRSCNARSCHSSHSSQAGSADLFLGPSLRDFDGGTLPPPDTGVLIAVHQELLAPSLLAPSMPRVTPGDPEQSFLMHKLDGTFGCGRIECPWNPATEVPGCGESQPYTAGELLDLDERNVIRRWIAQGAALGFGCDGSEPVTCEEAGGACCAGRCTSFSSTSDCGRCGNACAAPQMECVAGECVCPPNLPTLCNGECLYTLFDPMNCGGCGNRCAPHETCAEGRCLCFSADCFPPEAVCGGVQCPHPYPDHFAYGCCTSRGECGVDTSGLAYARMKPTPVSECVAIPAPGALDPSCPDGEAELPRAAWGRQKGCCARGTCGLMLGDPIPLGCIAMVDGARCVPAPADASASDGLADQAVPDAAAD